MDFTPGRLVVSLAGRDAKKTYVLLAEEGESVILSDGFYKPIEKPKKKKKKHVQLSHETTLTEKMKAGTVTNEEIKHTLKTEV